MNRGYLSLSSWTAAVAWAAVSGWVLAGETKSEPAAKAGGTANQEAVEKAAKEPAIAQASLAAQLALEGQKRQSPILLLAAAELLGDLKQGARTPEAVKISAQNGGAPAKPAAEAEQKPLPLKMNALVEAARKYAQNDTQLKALIDARAEAGGSRGIIYSQGKDMPKIDFRGTTFVCLKQDGYLAPGDTLTLSNVIFEGRKPAVVAAIGDGNGDLDMWVYDENTDGLIGKDTDSTSNCVVNWTPRYEGPFRIRVANVGRLPERYYILVNW